MIRPPPARPRTGLVPANARLVSGSGSNWHHFGADGCLSEGCRSGARTPPTPSTILHTQTSATTLSLPRPCAGLGIGDGDEGSLLGYRAACANHTRHCHPPKQTARTRDPPSHPNQQSPLHPHSGGPALGCRVTCGWPVDQAEAQQPPVDGAGPDHKPGHGSNPQPGPGCRRRLMAKLH